ncbi:uncharacterized protein LOC144133520 [Amblyomma americanum]
MPLTRSRNQAPDVPDDRSPSPADSADDAAAGAARPRRSEGLGSSQQPDAGVERLLDTVTQRMDAWEARLTAQAGEMEALRRELRRLVPAEPSTGQVPLGVLAAAIERLALQSLPGAPQNAVALVGTEAFVDAIRLPEVQRLVRSGHCLSRAPVDAPPVEDEDAFLGPICPGSCAQQQRSDPNVKRLIEYLEGKVS